MLAVARGEDQVVLVGWPAVEGQGLAGGGDEHVVALEGHVAVESLGLADIEDLPCGTAIKVTITCGPGRLLRAVPAFCVFGPLLKRRQTLNLTADDVYLCNLA